MTTCLMLATKVSELELFIRRLKEAGVWLPAVAASRCTSLSCITVIPSAALGTAEAAGKAVTTLPVAPDCHNHAKGLQQPLTPQRAYFTSSLLLSA